MIRTKWSVWVPLISTWIIYQCILNQDNVMQYPSMHSTHQSESFHIFHFIHNIFYWHDQLKLIYFQLNCIPATKHLWLGLQLLEWINAHAHSSVISRLLICTGSYCTIFFFCNHKEFRTFFDWFNLDLTWVVVNWNMSSTSRRQYRPR